MGRPEGDIERLGDGLQRHVEQVVQDDDGAVVYRQLPEPALQLVTMRDRSSTRYGEEASRYLSQPRVETLKRPIGASQALRNGPEKVG